MLTSILLRFRQGVGPWLLAVVLVPSIATAQSFTHVHLRSPDPSAAAEWYHTLLGGNLRPPTPGMGSVGQIHGSISTMFDEANAQPSSGSVIDHFGFAVADVQAMVDKARFMGAQIVAEPQPGVTADMIAMIEDPWGTRVELLESPGFRGIQHVHMVTEGAEALRDWLLQVFGGEYDPQSGGDSLHAIRYDGIWVYVSEAPEPPDPSILPDRSAVPDRLGQPEQLSAQDQLALPEYFEAAVRGTVPSRGRSLDHMGFSVSDMDEIVARVRASGYEPYVIRPNRPGGTTLLMFFEGANGVHFEISQPNGVQ